MATEQYEFARSSRDLLRLVGGLVLLLLGLVLATIFSDTLLGFETDPIRLVRGLPEGLAVLVFGTIRVLSLVAALGLVAWLAWRRPVAAAGPAGPGQRGRLGPAGRSGPGHQQGAGAEPGGHPAGGVGDRQLLHSGRGGNLAVAVATYVVARPLLAVPYRRLVVWVIALTAVFLVWAGSKASVVDLPSSTTILLAVVVVAAIIGLAVMIRPARLWLSFVGALLMDLAYIAALFASVRAFDAPVSVAVAVRSTSPAPPWPPPPDAGRGSAP